jgi:iron complex transport system permease protein
LLLVGVSLSFALSGITTFMQYATHDLAAQQAILFWLIGGLGGAEWSQIPLMAGVLAAGTIVIWYYARHLNALSVGDESASSLGMNPDQLRTRLFVILSLVVAAAVSMVGPVGFIGLVVPHVARLLVGAEHRRVIPVALVLGGTYLVSVDVIGRWLMAPSEIPVGVLTAILGTPFFIWLIRRRDAMAIGDAR